MRSFEEIYHSACLHAGGDIEQRLPSVRAPVELKALADAHYLSSMSRRIFRAGLKHSMVDAKWPAFEQAFADFNPLACASMSDEAIEAHLTNKALIRHFGKIKTIRHNALFVLDMAEEYGSFGQLLADWPVEDTIGLWLLLRKRGAHLGGRSSGQFLRMVGKDTFLFTDDVVRVLILEAVIDKAPSSQRDMRAAEQAFLTWHAECGRPLSEISRIVSMSVS